MAGVIVILLCLSGVSARAQYFRHFNTHQLLRASSVYQVSRDSKGFLWFCTDHGLVKYNGHTATHYTRQKGLPDDMIFNTYEDRQGRIWAFCYNGKYCFIDRDSIHNEDNDSLLAQLPHTNAFITCMAQAKDSSLYFGFSSRSILYLKGRHWVWKEVHTSFDNGIIVKEEQLTYTQSFGFNTLAADKKHRLLSDNEGIKIFLQDSLIWEISDEALNYKAVTDMFLTDDRKLLVSTLDGLVIIDLATKKQLKLLHGIRTSSCYTDVVGNFWITTLNNGVYLLHQELENIRMLTAFDGMEWTTVNDNRLVFTKNNVLYELRPDTGQLEVVAAVNNIPNYYNPVLLTDEIGIFYDTWLKYSYVISRSGGRPGKSRITIAAPDDNIFLKKMHVYGKRDFFAYGDRTVYHYQYVNGGFRYVDSSILLHKISASCQSNPSGAVYFSSGNTLYTFDFESSRVLPVFSATWLSHTTGLVCRDSCLMIATDEQQFYSLSPIDQKGLLKVYDYGFPVRDVAFLTADNLLLFSDAVDYLLMAKDAHGPQRVQYPFSSTEYEQSALLGKYYLVKLDGKIYYFDTSLINKHQPEASVYLKRLVINGKEYMGPDIDIRNTIKLNIQVSLGMLDFGSGTQAVRYRLLGPEGGAWNNTSAMELAFVLQKAGMYEIQIMPDNAGAGQPLVLKIHVHTPFLRSTIFYVLCCLVGLLICAGIVFLIVRYRKRHFLRELNYLRLEHRAINALLNPHFIFNSINNIQNLIHKSEAHEAAEYLAILSRLIRQNLENLQFNLIPLENELALIQRYIRLQNLRFNGLLSLEIDAGTSDLTEVHIPPLLVHTFVENAIVHGFRQRDKPFTIHIIISRSDQDYLRITIADNGVGLRKAAEVPAMHDQSSMGVSFNRKRLMRLSEFYKLQQSIELTDLSEAGGQGALVEIVLYARLKTLFEQKHLTAH